MSFLFVENTRYLLQLYPPYVMSMMYYMVSKQSASIVNIQEASVEKGPGFGLADLFSEPEVNASKLFGTIAVNVPKPIYCLLWLAFDTALFALLALYFDHVVPTGNGIIHPPLFFLKRSYWRPLRTGSERRGQHARLEEERGFSQVTELLGDCKSKDVIDEAVRVSERVGRYAEDDSVILVSMLTKSYGNACSLFSCLGRFGARCCGKGNVPKKAVDRLSMQLEKDAIFCLLGHNGAGKSTTINILTGIVAPSSGFVSICGHNLKDDLHSVQSMIGVSPQFDCLWGELSAMQHLKLYVPTVPTLLPTLSTPLSSFDERRYMYRKVSKEVAK